MKKEQLSVKPERERPRRHDYDGDEGHMQRPPPFEYRPRKRRTIDPDERLHIYRGESLGIFSKTTATGVDAVGPALDTWHRLQRQELKMMVTHPPTNGFEEMIRWTEQGKLWRYPIDNEQGSRLSPLFSLFFDSIEMCVDLRESCLQELSSILEPRLSLSLSPQTSRASSALSFSQYIYVLTAATKRRPNRFPHAQLNVLVSLFITYSRSPSLHRITFRRRAQHSSAITSGR